MRTSQICRPAVRLHAKQRSYPRASSTRCRAGVQAAPAVAEPNQVKLVRELDPDTFAAMTASSDLPVLVDFFTQWCGPCKVIAPQVEALAAEFQGRMLMTKFDCGAHDKRFAIERGIKALPTFHVYHRGVKLGEMSGAKVDKLRALIEEHALAAAP